MGKHTATRPQTNHKHWWKYLQHKTTLHLINALTNTNNKPAQQKTTTKK